MSLQTTPTPALSTVQTDAFCECGYNLHGQLVWRDRALDILVCRCPECGRHAAAGRFTGIHSAWLSRLSMALIVGWVFFLLGLFFLLGTLLGAPPNAHLDEYKEASPVASTSPTQTNYVQDLRSLESYEREHPWLDVWPYVTGAVLISFLMGIFASVFLWHLRERAYLFALVPFLSMAILYAIWNEPNMTPNLLRWAQTRLAMYAVLEAGCILMAIRLGRPFARVVLGTLLPKRLLQHLAFLWARDNKMLPSPKNAEGR